MIEDAVELAGSAAAETHAPVQAATRRPLRGAGPLVAMAALLALFLGLPVFTLLVRAVLDGSLAGAVVSPVVIDALSLSLVTTAISLALTVTFGVPLAFVLARRRFPGKGLLEAVIDLPIVLPPSLAGAALAAGLVMSWARSLGEFGATIMFAGNVEGRTQTLPLVVYGEFQGGNLDSSIAAAAILVLAAFGVLVAVRVMHWGRVLETRGSG